MQKNLLIFIVLLLISLGIGTYFVISNKRLYELAKQVNPFIAPESTKTSIISNPAESSESTTTVSGQTVDNLVWETYQDEKYKFLTFKYPEGAEIVKSIDPNPDVCSIAGCFTTSLRFEDLHLKITHFTGIGGRGGATSFPYDIVSGNHFEGVGKYVKRLSGDGSIDIQYFSYRDGGIGFGSFLVDTTNFVFTMPVKRQKAYEPIADIIACSVLDKTPEYNSLFARAYLSPDQAIIGVNPDRSEFTLFKSDPSTMEKIDNLTINATGEYIAFTTIIGNGPNFNLYFYDLANKQLIAFDGENKITGEGLALGSTEKWADDYTFIKSEPNKKYSMYDLKNKTRQDITFYKYNSYMDRRY